MNVLHSWVCLFVFSLWCLALCSRAVLSATVPFVSLFLVRNHCSAHFCTLLCLHMVCYLFSCRDNYIYLFKNTSFLLINIIFFRIIYSAYPFPFREPAVVCLKPIRSLWASWMKNLCWLNWVQSHPLKWIMSQSKYERPSTATWLLFTSMSTLFQSI